MKRRLNIQRRAELEMNRAIIWYEEKRLGLGRDFLSDLRTTLKKIRNTPLAFPLDYRHARRALLENFPYKVYFVVSDNAPIDVIGVLHTSQDTSRLDRRL